MFYLCLQIFGIWMETLLVWTCFRCKDGHSVVPFDIRKLRRALMWSMSECLSNLNKLVWKGSQRSQQDWQISELFHIILCHIASWTHDKKKKLKKNLTLLSFRFCWSDFSIFWHSLLCGNEITRCREPKIFANFMWPMYSQISCIWRKCKSYDVFQALYYSGAVHCHV